jgi:hypothetical protein
VRIVTAVASIVAVITVIAAMLLPLLWLGIG